MGSRMKVGVSHVTPGKHALIEDLLERDIRVTNAMSVRRGEKQAKRFFIFDLTAGSGTAPEGCEWESATSSGLAISRAYELKVPALIYLYEKAHKTFRLLIANLDENAKRYGLERTAERTWEGTTKHGAQFRVKALCQSSDSAPVDFLNEHDVVFVSNDPNAITTWALRPTFSAEVRRKGCWRFTCISTMGCNVGGIKRNPFEYREHHWYPLLQAVQATLMPHRDLALATLDNDASQWGYLVETPDAWHRETERLIHAAFLSSLDRTVTITWYRRTPDEFERQKDVLFLTKKEREGSFV